MTHLFFNFKILLDKSGIIFISFCLISYLSQLFYEITVLMEIIQYSYIAALTYKYLIGCLSLMYPGPV